MPNTDHNAPLLRMYYLQQLGIACYVPRQPLPGALASEVTGDVAEDVVNDALQGAAIDDAGTATGGSILAELIPPEPAAIVAEEKSAMAVAAEPAATRPAAARVRVEEAPALPASPRQIDASPAAPAGPAASPFQILFAVPSTELAVAVQIPSAMTPVLREVDARLLTNMLRWLGVGWPTSASPLHFRWPLPGMPAADLAQAGKGLQAFLHQAALEQPFQRLLVFGSEPQQALRACGGDQQGPWQAWYTHSLTELLALPSLKRETWQTLLPLRAQLSS